MRVYIYALYACELCNNNIVPRETLVNGLGINLWISVGINEAAS